MTTAVTATPKHALAKPSSPAAANVVLAHLQPAFVEGDGAARRCGLASSAVALQAEIELQPPQKIAETGATIRLEADVAPG